jgi:hypothetical protein
MRLLEPHDVNCTSVAQGKTGVCVRVTGINACDAGVTQNLPLTDEVDFIDSSRGFRFNKLRGCNVTRRIRLTGPAATNLAIFNRLLTTHYAR